MKDTYMLQPEVTADQNSKTGDDWVVIRRRKVPGEIADAMPHMDEEVTASAPEAQSVKDAEVLAEPLVEEEPPVEEIDQSIMRIRRAPTPAACDVQGALDDEILMDQGPALESDETAVHEFETSEHAFEDVAPLNLGVEHAVPATIVADETQQPRQDLWRDLPRVSMGAQVDGKPVRRAAPSLIEYFRADPIAKGFDLLRTRLVRTIRAYGWRRIAVVAPTSGCGATFTAVNLALSLSRVPGSRTVLMDMNQRAPGVADALGIRNPGRLDEFLMAESAIEDYLVRPSNTLAVGLADAPCALAAEMLHDPLSAEVLEEMIEELDPDLVIYDMPPILVYDDLAAFLPNVDGVLLVADGTQTLPAHIAACERILEGQTQLLGVVLNRGRMEGNLDIAV